MPLYSEAAANPAIYTKFSRTITLDATAVTAKVQFTGIDTTSATKSAGTTTYVDNISHRDTPKTLACRVTGSTGAIVTQTGGLAVTRLGAGSYRITHNFGHTNYAPVATCGIGEFCVIDFTTLLANYYQVTITSHTGGTGIDEDFSTQVVEW